MTATVDRDVDIAEIRMWVEQLKAARKERGWTVLELARRSGLSKSLLRKWESHVHMPNVWSLMAWARALGFELQMVPQSDQRGDEQ